jgi:hypothetical protein
LREYGFGILLMILGGEAVQNHQQRSASPQLTFTIRDARIIKKVLVRSGKEEQKA